MLVCNGDVHIEYKNHWKNLNSFANILAVFFNKMGIFFFKDYEQPIKATGHFPWGNPDLFCPLGFSFCSRRKLEYPEETCNLRLGTERNPVLTYNLISHR